MCRSILHILNQPHYVSFFKKYLVLKIKLLKTPLLLHNYKIIRNICKRWLTEETPYKYNATVCNELFCVNERVVGWHHHLNV